jgi:hypothetical protein
MKEIRQVHQTLRLSSSDPVPVLAKTSSFPWLEKPLPGKQVIPDQ